VQALSEKKKFLQAYATSPIHETELKLGWQRLAVCSLPNSVRTLVLTGI